MNGMLWIGDIHLLLLLCTSVCVCVCVCVGVLELISQCHCPVEQTLDLLLQLFVTKLALLLELELIGSNQRIVELQCKPTRLEELLQCNTQSTDMLLGILDTLVTQKVASNLNRSSIYLCWVGLGWVGLGWVGLGWVGLGWVGLGWVGLGWVG
jgi:hypothetical protein